MSNVRPQMSYDPLRFFAIALVAAPFLMPAIAAFMWWASIQHPWRFLALAYLAITGLKLSISSLSAVAVYPILRSIPRPAPPDGVQHVGMLIGTAAVALELIFLILLGTIALRWLRQPLTMAQPK
jgi:hypothetical protein